MALPTASDNKFPKLILEERLSDGSDTSNPAADHRALFLGEDGLLHLRDSAGTVTDIVDGSAAAHIADTTDAHDASAVSFDATGLDNTAATEVQTALEDFDAAISAAGGASLTSSSNSLSGDVTMTNANQYYDGPAISLAAGTWFLSGNILNSHAASQDQITAKLWDGTTVIDSGYGLHVLAGFALSIHLSGRITLGSTTTCKISVASNSAGAKILKAAPTNGAGDNASTLTAVKIA